MSRVNERLGGVHHHPADSHFVTTILSRLPLALQGSVSKTYGYQFDTNGRQAANHYLLAVQDDLQGKTLLTLSDENIRLKAERLAVNFRSDDLSKAIQYLASQGFDLPAGDTGQGILARVKCAIWWQRALRRKQDREQEQLSIQLGLVRKGLQPYCSGNLAESYSGPSPAFNEDSGRLLRQCRMKAMCSVWPKS